jgi:hypothetical protein
LSWQPSLSLLLPPQLPNAVVLSAAITAAVAFAHLFDSAIKWRWCLQWQRKQRLRRQWWVSNGNGNNMHNGDGNKVVGDKESNGKSSNSNDDGDEGGNGDSVKSKK